MYVPEGWRKAKLKNVATIKSGATPLRSKGEEYFTSNGMPWIKTMDMTNTYIFKTEEQITKLALDETSCSVFPKNSVLIAMYGGFNQIGRTGLLTQPSAINQAISCLQLNQNIVNPLFVLNWLNANVKLWKRFAASSRKDPNITRGDVCSFPILIPPLPEQQKIAQILSTWDRAIEKLEALISAKQKRKRALMQQLLAGKKRFAEFIKSEERRQTRFGTIPIDWKYLQIGEVARQLSLKNNEGKDLQVLSCTKHYGLVDSLSYFGKQIFSEDTSTYKVVPRNAFAYATNHIEEGSIGYQNICDKALISPMYTVFQTVESIINDNFLFRLLKTELYRHIFEVNTSASVDRRGSLRWSQFAHIRIPIPSLPEQQKIASVLSVADKGIEIQQNQLSALKQQKKGLMQQLLTGKRRVQLEKETENVSV